ncbi:MAG TPA: hypothetical protein P5089_03940 [Candidatus Portnoybacteria bacterium]|nr:hypothetical protein [Candidatus Portnoybacteria bacterium]
MIKDSFIKSLQEFQDAKNYNPWLVSTTKNPSDETPEKVEERQKKFLQIPESAQNILASQDTANIIKKISQDLKLTLWQAAEISRSVRAYYFREMAPAEIISSLTINADIDTKRAEEIYQRLATEIFNARLASQRKLIYLPIDKALTEYPKIKKQAISSNPIKIRGFIDLVAPSVENWLQDYKETAGAQDHEADERAEYLFNSQNTKNLAQQDRQQLSKVIEAVDENSTIGIDPDNQLIIFERAETESEEKQIKPQPSIQAVFSQKTLRQIAKDNKDLLNQNLTSAPIKIADFEQPVRPTIKNWLVDYVKIKGAGHHESLERGDYLFSNPNAKQLSETERNLVSAILKAYDDDLPLPVNAQDQTILLENIITEKTIAQAPISATSLNTPSGYREPIAKEDLIGPLKNQTPPKNTPKLSGNIIDLKDIQ